MNTFMFALVPVLATLALVALTWFLRGALAKYIRKLMASSFAELMGEAQSIIDEAHTVLPELRSWNARAMTTARTVERKLGNGATAGSDDDGGGLPAWVQGLAESVGIDTAKLMRGDPGEMEKAKGVAMQLKNGQSQGPDPRLFM